MFWWKIGNGYRVYETLFQCVQNAGLFESSLLPIRNITIGHFGDILYETNSLTIKTTFVLRYGNFEIEFDKLMEAMDYYHSFLQNPAELYAARLSFGTYNCIGGSILKNCKHRPTIILNFDCVRTFCEEIDWAKEGF
jgi:hypothetical protein